MSSRRSRETLLELAAGAGDTGFDAAALTGESGQLITSDVSPVMLDVRAAAALRAAS